ncbi:MAG: YbaY family lipoprotein [Actinomycetota bacterium]
MPFPLPRLIGSAAVVVVLAAGCGDESDTSVGADPTTTTTTVQPTDPTTAPDSRTVVGDITIRGADEMSQLPDGARVVVRVEDISIADGPSVTLGEATYENVATLPLTYEVTWTPLDDSGADISVSVSIYVGDELAYVSDTVHPVAETVAVEVISTALDESFPGQAEADALAASVVGMSEADARSTLSAAGFTPRVTLLDGEPQPGNLDFRVDRINLEIADGVVTGASVG